MNELWKVLIFMGVILMLFGIIGGLLSNVTSIPKLPGDIYIKREGFSFYFPITTSIIISIILTVLISLFMRK
jgi:hypothetical protein